MAPLSIFAVVEPWSLRNEAQQLSAAGIGSRQRSMRCGGAHSTAGRIGSGRPCLAGERGLGARCREAKGGFVLAELSSELSLLRSELEPLLILDRGVLARGAPFAAHEALAEQGIASDSLEVAPIRLSKW